MSKLGRTELHEVYCGRTDIQIKGKLAAHNSVKTKKPKKPLTFDHAYILSTRHSNKNSQVKFYSPSKAYSGV